jgi:myo-inositol-1(or 4)-monophosphatase
MPDKQLLHLVIGGELSSLEGPPVFRDLHKVDLVGAYPSYDEALKAWRAKAQATVDNAHARYFIIHAHKLLDPGSDGDGHDHEH